MGREPRHAHNTKGLVHNETMLYAPDFFWHLREVGIVHMGMITGRIGPEVDSALERIEAYSGERWWEVVVPADQYAKPDPQALRFASQAVSAHAGLYIGDTADDFDLVRRYRLVQQSQAGDVDFLAAMVAHPGEVGLYQERGADIILANVEQLLDVLSVKR